MARVTFTFEDQESGPLDGAAVLDVSTDPPVHPGMLPQDMTAAQVQAFSTLGWLLLNTSVIVRRTDG